jgi:hypothetical protein
MVTPGCNTAVPVQDRHQPSPCKRCQFLGGLTPGLGLQSFKKYIKPPTHTAVVGILVRRAYNIKIEQKRVKGFFKCFF